MAQTTSRWRPSERWETAHSAFESLLTDLEVEGALTVLVRLIPIAVESADDFVAKLRTATNDPNEEWAYMVLNVPDSPTGHVGLAMPLAKGKSGSLLAALFPYVEIHTAMVAWWLTTAWRAQQLAQSGMSLAIESKYVPAAAMVRPLVETAAAFWCDGVAIAEAWREVKESADPLGFGSDSYKTYSVLAPLRQALFAGRFREPKATDLTRTNVLTQLGRLFRAADASLEDDYELLCNTVHPSLGTLKAFQTPTVQNLRFPAEQLTLLASKPLLLGTPSGVEQEVELPEALDRAAAVSLEILRRSLDAALSLIDDVALVSRAPSIARTPYWRMVEAPSSPTEACPCRSGTRWEKCQDQFHRWGRDAQTVSLPATFR